MSDANAPGAIDLAARHASGAVRVRDTIERALARIEARERSVGALAAVHAEDALRRADELDAGAASGSSMTLLGVPLIVKANMCVAGHETHCGSRLLAGYRAPYTATFVERAEAAGAVVVATAHMDEFAMGSSGEHSAFGVARNPWDLARAPGGSSSGSAAAVAAGYAPLALGSDTGGSVRQPAAFSGVVGFKPTWGRISRFGLVAFGSSLDVVAPLATSVRDVELAFGVLAGEDARDATSLRGPAPPPEERDDLTGLRVGVAPELFPDAVEADVRASVDAALETLRARGATLVEVSLPNVPHALATYYVVATAEASSNLARFDGVRFGQRVEGDGSLEGMMRATRTAGFGAEVKRRILLGTYVLSSGYQDRWYGRAQRVRAALGDEFGKAFEVADVLAAPTSPTPAFRLGERSDPLAMYAADVLTVPASLAGLPAVSTPCGTVERDGRALPVGLQLIGPRGADARVLAAARVYEDARGPFDTPAEVPA